MICETLTYLNLTYYLAYLLYVFDTQTASLAKVIVKETAYCYHLFFLILMLHYINIISDRTYRYFSRRHATVSTWAAHDNMFIFYIYLFNI